MTRRVLITTILMMVVTHAAFSQAVHTITNYKKALWMTTRFYGGQRSGDNNWLLYNHLPSGVNAALTGRAFRADAHTDGTDLSGGWHDCGDHVKFGQTQFYSAYILLKGYSEFPTGYDDRYSQNYTGYKAAGNWTFEGAGHDPNCIPDVLDEMKHETDFLIKCIPNATNFYYQVGNGGAGADHCQWVTAVKSQTYATSCGGNNDNGTTATPLRPACKNPNDASMASFCGATLALMSRMYQPYDATYAALCLTHAQYAYTYAKNHSGTAGTCFSGFYNANDHWEDDYVSMCCELYWATNNNAYKTEAEGMEGSVVFNTGWSFDYSNNGEIALYNLAKLGNANGLSRFNSRMTGHFMAAGSRNAQGVYTAYGSGWGELRYSGNAAFLIALYSKLNNNISAATLNYMYKDIDYVMGNNSANRSYIVGFLPTGSHVAPLQPHHRNVYLVDNNPPDSDNSLVIPTKNQQFGALVGGKRDATFNDKRSEYANTEVCIDYNAGLVGALGYINSLLSPVTINCGANACWRPNLGADKSTCSQSLPITLDANAGNAGGVISYRWYTWNGTTKTVISGQTARTYSANAIGGYIVERDSAFTGGPCTKRDTIWITNTIPTPVLTGPLEVCNPATYNLTPTNLASMPGGTTYQWAVDYSGGTSYSNLTGETGSTLANVRRAGRYRITATSGTCNSNDDVVITSLLPTPVDGCSASTGSVSLSIANVGTGPYQWYAAATGGSSLGTGTTFITPSISSTTTYYVQDMAAASGTVGPTTQLGAGTNWGISTGLHTNFTISQNVTVNSLQIPFLIYSNVTGSVDVEILDNSGNAFSPAKIFTSDPVSVTTAQNNTLITFPFTGFTIQSAWGTNLRIRLVGKGAINGDPVWSAGAASYPYNSSPGGIMSITGQSGGGATQYNYFYNWQISTGTPCSRLPVIAKIGSCSAVPVQFLSFTGKDNVHSVLLTWITGREKNNDRFTVMKSLDGENFEAIGTVKGKGDSNNPTQYSFADAEAEYGVNYYKIVQHDYNGETDQTEVLLVNKISKVEMLVAPNPFNNSTEIRLVSSVEGAAELIVRDLHGNVVEERAYQLNSQTTVGAQLPVGVYVVQIITGDQVVTTRIVKK